MSWKMNSMSHSDLVHNECQRYYVSKAFLNFQEQSLNIDILIFELFIVRGDLFAC